MPTVALRWKITAVCVLLGGGASWLHGVQGRGEAKKAPPPKAPAAGPPTPLYFGVGACSNAGCHTLPAPTKWPRPLLCRCDEGTRWAEKDKHGDAYRVLLGDRSKRMGAILKLTPHQDARCLSCHAAVVEDKELLKRSQEVFFKLEDGVSCVVCHGAHQEWVTKHGAFLEVPKWRPLTRAQKEAQFGMRDLWDPVKRAELCASCHIGNVGSSVRKFVTHEMYAAGHPPLPGFEVAFFSDQMPRHWQYRSEKKDASVRKELGYDGKEQEQTKLVLVGAAVSLREAMRLLEAQADECRKAKEPGLASLDLANFDCYACHHELRSTSWRQKRGFAGRPGRVPMRPWPTALVKLALRHAAADEAEARRLSAEYDKQWQALRAAFDRRPYGSPAHIAPAAKKLGDWADGLARALDKKGCDPPEARKLLAGLPGLYKDEALDYDSARQVGWALRVLCQELEGGGREVDGALALLDRHLKLTLPVRAEGAEGRKQGSIVKELPDRLRHLSRYDPAVFRKALLGLEGRLGKKPPPGGG
jgi:hypothetical protein